MRLDFNGLCTVVKKMTKTADDETALEGMALYPDWRAGTIYAAGDRIRYSGRFYKANQAHTSQAGWEPDASKALFSEIGNPAEEWPEWIMPEGAHNAYAKGDKVTHAGKHWISDLDNNVWEPGVSGWTEQEAV